MRWSCLVKIMGSMERAHPRRSVDGEDAIGAVGNGAGERDLRDGGGGVEWVDDVEDTDFPLDACSEESG